METYTEPQKQITVADEADVLVVGACLEGFSAAMCARDSIEPRELDVSALQAKLLRVGVEP